jgi:hypothetical protein
LGSEPKAKPTGSTKPFRDDNTRGFYADRKGPDERTQPPRLGKERSNTKQIDSPVLAGARLSAQKPVLDVTKNTSEPSQQTNKFKRTVPDERDRTVYALDSMQLNSCRSGSYRVPKVHASSVQSAEGGKLSSRSLIAQIDREITGPSTPDKHTSGRDVATKHAAGPQIKRLKGELSTTKEQLHATRTSARNHQEENTRLQKQMMEQMKVH